MKALARPGGPAAMLPTVKGLASAGIKKGLRYGLKKAHHALRSGALLHSGGSAKTQVENAKMQMRPNPSTMLDKKWRPSADKPARKPTMKKAPDSVRRPMGPAKPGNPSRDSTKPLMLKR